MGLEGDESMLKRIMVLSLAALFGICLNGWSQESVKPKKLLVITESKGFVHSVVKRPKADEFCLVEKVLTKLGKDSGKFEVTCSQDSRKEITAENLAKYDAVFFYTTGELPLSETQKADLLDFVRSGKGFTGSHCASDTFYKWPEYGNLVGGYFDGHPWHEKIKVEVENSDHPSMKHLGKEFEITDEIYQFKAPYDRSKLNVLMHMKLKEGEKRGNRKDGDYALTWTKDYGKGRVFYTALGHREDVWEDPRFQTMMVEGILWSCGGK